MSNTEETTSLSPIAVAVADYLEAADGDSADAEHDAANTLAGEAEALMVEHPRAVAFGWAGGQPVAVFDDRAGWLVLDWAAEGVPRLTRHESEGAARDAANLNHLVRTGLSGQVDRDQEGGV